MKDMDPHVPGERLANRKGAFGFTPLYEAVASGKPEVLKFLLEQTGNANVTMTKYHCGYTLLHLAVSCGHGKCVRELLKHGADMSCVDEYGKTPKQIAKLSSKSSILKILCSEGKSLMEVCSI